ncbi:transposase [Streptococcus suis]|nr:transposase [Streptococcus suis]
MRVVFGIDVSKVSSEVAILVNGEKVHNYTMSNDAIGFSRLLGDLKTVHTSLKQQASILVVFKLFWMNMATLIHDSIP